MVIKVLNKKWKIVVRSDEAHDKRFPNCHAMAVYDDRKIHVRKSSLNKVTVIHEILHCYKFELSYYELELDDDQTDEWHCELWAKHGEIISKDANRLLKQYAIK
jgi:hypothetical protein